MKKLSQVSSPHLQVCECCWLKVHPFIGKAHRTLATSHGKDLVKHLRVRLSIRPIVFQRGWARKIFFHICSGTQALKGWVHVKLRRTGLMCWTQTLKNTRIAGLFGSMIGEGIWKRRATTVPCCPPPTRCASSACNPDAPQQQHKTISSSLTKQSTTKISSHSSILKVTLHIRGLPWIRWLLNPLKTNYQPLHTPMPIRTLKRTSSNICPSVIISIQFWHSLLLCMTVKESYFILDTNCPRSLEIFFSLLFHTKYNMMA